MLFSELLLLTDTRYYPRILYIDIDIHHGDGVELAFYQSNRVMTLSFHKYTGDFFPGTGKLDDNGMGQGKHFALNVPLLDGITDDMYLTVFKTVVEDTVTAFRPSAIVLQCGADSLGCDRLGAFNLSIWAHGECVDFVRRCNVPLLVLGGGGYTIKNVSRCWTYETSVLVGADVSDELPRTVYDSFFRDSKWKLHPELTGKVENQNSSASLQRIMAAVRSKLRYLQGAPSVEMQELPPDLAKWLEQETGEQDRLQDRAADGRNDRTMARNEFYEGDKDNDQDDLPAVRRKVSGRGRGRGRGRARATVTKAREDGDEDSEPVTPKPRGRPRGRGRGRGRGRAKATVTVEEREQATSKDASPDDEPSAAPSVEQSVEPASTTEPVSKGAPMDVDVE
jgi:hypothetical protein